MGLLRRYRFGAHRDEPQANAERRAEMLRQLKPHIPEPAALRAVRAVDEIRAEAQALAA